MTGWGVAAGVVLLAAAGRGWAYTETQRPSLAQHEVSVPGLPAAWADAQLLQLSDLHVRRWGRLEARVAALVERIDPEVLLLTGDYLEEPGAERALSALLQRIVPGRQALAVLGDNDVEERAGAADLLQAHGVHVLHNEALALSRRGTSGALWIAGVDDPHTGQDDLDRALAAVPAARPVLLLAHSPEIAPKLLRHPQADQVVLTLSGHTHGGQICLPGVGAIYTNARTGLKYRAGSYRLGGGRLYVSRGLGTSRMQARLFCRPEVTGFRLRARDKER